MKKIYLFLVQTLLVLSLVFAVGCNKDDKGNDIPSGGFKVGQKYQGGIIAYVDGTGQHGLIAAPEDQSSGISWDSRWNEGEVTFEIETGATGTKIGTGKSNTAKIIQSKVAGAAKLCDDLDLNGYSDWFLPSRDELDELYKNRASIGGFSPKEYWSSSESTYVPGSDSGEPYLTAWYENFYDGGQNSDSNRGYDYRVRAVRAF